LSDRIRLHSDIGYNYDIDEASLRRFTWRMGGSVAIRQVSVDLGLGGSEYDAPIQWTPTVLHGERTATVPPFTARALDDTTAGDSYVDVLLGMKLRVTETWILAGAVTIPVVREEFQPDPDVLWTLALERYF